MRDPGWNDEQDYFEGPGLAFDAARERRRRGLDCRDGMCAARDCRTCFPGGEAEDDEPETEALSRMRCEREDGEQLEVE